MVQRQPEGRATLMVGLPYSQADFLISEAKARGFAGISALVQEILAAEIERRRSGEQGAADYRRSKEAPVVGSR